LISSQKLYYLGKSSNRLRVAGRWTATHPDNFGPSRSSAWMFWIAPLVGGILDGGVYRGLFAA
jgi:glycerol uptake facilitator-like aquaporin